MKKLWAKNYFMLSSLVILVLVAVCSYALVSRNISQAESKHIFESIYTETSIDFIVPSPDYDQASVLENDSATGIEVMTPYYETSTPVNINGSSSGKGTVLIFPDVSHSEYTPYSQARVITGEKAVSEEGAIIDTKYAEKNGCKVGDTISITLADQDYVFTVLGIALPNTYYNEGSAALFLNDSQAVALQEAGIKYSASYVKASDYENCKNYLYSDYKPLGRLKSRGDFDSEEAYNQHVTNFNEADWSKEITNCVANYEELQIKYVNVETGIWINIGIYAVVAFILIIVMNSLLLHKESIRQFMRTFLIKKGGTKNEIAGFYSKGIVYDMILFIVMIIAGYIAVIINTTVSMLGSSIMNVVVPSAAVIIASLIMLGISKSYVMRNYTMPKKKEDNGEITNLKNSEQ